MADAKCVIFTHFSDREGRNAVWLAQAMHLFSPAGQYFVRVSLVADVPDESVQRRIENIMQGNG